MRFQQFEIVNYFLFIYFLGGIEIEEILHLLSRWDDIIAEGRKFTTLKIEMQLFRWKDIKITPNLVVQCGAVVGDNSL
jgi:predicted transcriptional regulator